MTAQASTRPPRPRGKEWAFRLLAAVGIPCALVLGLEFGLRLAGHGRPAQFLIPDDKPGFYRSNPNYVSLFLPSTFDLQPLHYRLTRQKPPNTVRIVVLGESAAQGVPEPAFGFAPQLRALLRARHPDQNIEVINTGIVAINSHVVYQIARDLADFSPDLFVVYLGNNEVVGPYGPGCSYLSDMPPLWVIRLSVFVRTTQTGQLLGELLGRLASRRAPSPEWGGMAMFVESAVRGDDPRLEQVYRNFEANLEGIVRTAGGAGAKTLLCTVVSNVKDCPPLLSLHRPDLSAPESAVWGKAFNAGRVEWLLGEDAAARTHLQEALRLDPHYADTSFMLGSIEARAGATEAARQHFLAAQHWDALRFRPDPRLNEIVRSVVGRHGASTSLVDTAVLLGSDPASPAPPTGRELFFEHVHPDWEGNYRLALAMAQGAETALFGGGARSAAWLDSAGCAAALAYTPHARSAVLQQVATITHFPPFTNQLTYPEDMRRFARDLAQAESDRTDRETQRRSWTVVQAAIAHDPQNPFLAKLAGDLADDMGDPAAGLREAQRARQLQPEYFRLAAGEAIKLLRLERFDEAEKLLRQTAAACSPRDLVTIAPTFVYLYSRTKRFAEGRRTLDEFLARRPGDPKLMLLQGRLAGFARDVTAAEQHYRAVLARDPGNQEALEALVTLLHTNGREADAERECLAAAARQPRNQANSLRAALLAERQGDDAGAAGYLLAAEHSGAVTAGLELQLARKLHNLGRADDALLHLVWARRLSEYEGDPLVTKTITDFIAQLRAASTPPGTTP